MSAEPGLTDSDAYRELWNIVYEDSRGRGYASARVASQLRELAELRRAADELVLRLVDDGREAGLTWERIGSLLGVTKQAASQLHKSARGRR